jgi:hypothetical protein
MSELEVEFEKVRGEKVVPTRYLKSQQQKQAKMAVEAVAAGSAEGEDITALVISGVEFFVVHILKILMIIIV